MQQQSFPCQPAQFGRWLVRVMTWDWPAGPVSDRVLLVNPPTMPSETASQPWSDSSPGLGGLQAAECRRLPAHPRGYLRIPPTQLIVRQAICIP